MSRTEQTPCTRCPRRDACTTPCERLEKLLPKPNVGGHTVTIPPDLVDEQGHWRQAAGQGKREIFRIFLARREALTERQWRCIELVYAEDLSPNEAARVLGISQPVVTRHIQRACRRLLRKMGINPCSYGGAQQNGGAR